MTDESTTDRAPEADGPPPATGPASFLYGWKALLLILLIGLGARLYRIDNPVLDRQGWRQCDTAMIARNYHEKDMNLLRPEVDWNGDNGVVQCEFPLVPYLAAILYRVFGLHVFLARLVSVLFALGTMVYLFLLARRLFGEPAAGFAGIFFAVLPFSVFFTRTVQPESAMLFFTTAGFWHLVSWLDARRPPHLALSILFFAFLFLVKVSNVFLGLPILFLFQRRMGWRLFLRPVPWAFAALVLLPAVAWSLYSDRLLQESGITFFDIWDKITGPVHGETHIYPLYWKYYWRIWYKRLFVRNLLVGGAVFLGAGLFLHERKPYRGFLFAWAGAVLLFMFVFAQGHYVHDYYQLPLFLPVVLFMGAGAARLWNRARPLAWKDRLRSPLLLLAAAAIPVMIPVGLHQVRRWYRIKEDAWRFCRTVDRTVEPDATILVDTGNAEYFYYLHRKGFRIPLPYMEDETALRRIRDLRTNYYYCTRWSSYEEKPRVRDFLLEHGRLVLEEGEMRLYALPRPPGEPEAP